jgi:hypothetical protein
MVPWRRVALVSITTVVICAAPASAGKRKTYAFVTPSFSLDQLGARSALTLRIDYVGGEFGVPSPVSRLVIKLPAGLSLDIPSLASCTATRLRARGPRGCPAQSKIGAGQAFAKVRAGSQIITEHFAMWAFLGPLLGNQPTVEMLGQGLTPFEERMVITGTILPDHSPYGEALVMSIPPIPTLPLEPNASIVNFSLTLGASRRTHHANTVVVPSVCPAGGFPFAAEFTYTDGSTGSVLTAAPCPA